MSNITALRVSPPIAADAAKRLRELADDVEAGQVSSMIVAYVQDGNFCFMWPSSLIDSLTLATLAQTNAVDRMRR